MSLDMFQCLLVYNLWELEQNLYPAFVLKHIFFFIEVQLIYNVVLVSHVQ